MRASTRSPIYPRIHRLTPQSHVKSLLLYTKNGAHTHYDLGVLYCMKHKTWWLRYSSYPATHKEMSELYRLQIYIRSCSSPITTRYRIMKRRADCSKMQACIVYVQATKNNRLGTTCKTTRLFTPSDSTPAVPVTQH